ncbi:MAG TPA: adenylyl-sulfate kinase [Bacteroidetes bacterium]|nr:adenylyl-sulfate kinase [Bacteroidota bacterium]
MPDVVWITGLSGAGKSTVAKALVGRLQQAGRPVVFLDGDELRAVFSHAVPSADGHSREQRLELALMYARLCKLLAQQGLCVVIATISMFREVHSWNRENIPGYFEVYLKVPIDELRRRDPKGIYRRFADGDVKNVAGLDLKVDEPARPDVIVDHADARTVEEAVDEIIQRIQEAQ